jgi:hypothetical protein
VNDCTPRPLDWTAPSDPEIAGALARQTDLRDRWRRASSQASEANEVIGRAEREHRARRAGQLARGGPDVGAFDPTKLQRTAREAEQTAEALQEAYRRSRQVALDLALARQGEWAEAAGDRLERARDELVAVLDKLAAPMAEFRAALVEALLAGDPSLRERQVAKAERLVPPGPSLEELRAFAASSPATASVGAVAAEE